MGLGPALSSLDPDYPYVLDSLKEQGFINSRAFTLDLRSIDSPDDGISLLSLPSCSRQLS